MGSGNGKRSETYPPFKRLIIGLERLLLRRFDCVSTISNRMLSKLFQKGVPSNKTLLFPNWVDTEVIYPLNGLNSFRKELGIPEDKVVALYSGNMGQKQGIDILIDVARRLKNRNIQFVLCGEGAVVNTIRNLAADLPDVIFLPLQPPEKLNDLLNLADIHLLPQKAEAADLVMPSKLTGIFASGRPVVAMAKQDTEIGKVVWGRGVLVPPGDAAAFANAIIRLAENPEEREKLGMAARDFAVKELNRKKILSQFTDALNPFA
ncbi:MAG: WcaI family glycosyltransferase [Desulfobacterales bacterium]|nr:WcaI family glycosyltransferase [Desulfobacterales bacterium]